MNVKMNEIRKDMNILKEDMNILNKREVKNKNLNDNDDDGDDDDDDDEDDANMKLLRFRKKRKKRVKKKMSFIKTTPFFKRKVLWAAVSEQTASSVKLAPRLHSTVDAVLSALSYWKEKNMVMSHGHNGHKLINELKINQIDLNSGFI